MSCRRAIIAIVALSLMILAHLTGTAESTASAAEFKSAIPKDVTRHWLGKQYWSNPLQDWQINDGRIECIKAAGNRNVHLLTHRLGEGKGAFEMSVTIGRLAGQNGNAGFRIGLKGQLKDYRHSLLFGKGLDVGMTTDGQLFIGKQIAPKAAAVDGPIKLTLIAEPDDDKYKLTLIATTGKVINFITKTVNADQLVGGVALVSNFDVPTRAKGKAKPAKKPGNSKMPKGPKASFWFSDFKLAGAKVVADQDRAFGPILFAMHTLSRGVMKMTAQMPPIGKTDAQEVRLQIKQGSDWKEMAQAKIDPLSRTATFRIPEWNDKSDVAYRLAYADTQPDGTRADAYYTGTVRRDPVDKKQIVIAGFTGHQDYLFPNDLMAANVAKLNPDVLVFTGDQLYEGNAGFGIIRTPPGDVNLACIDYLRKWYVWGWGFRDLMRDRPTLCLPDDHDVYQGNIWGQGGRDAGSMRNHAKGGYAMGAKWINAVQRTQCAHHPDPYDATPVDQGITVYYGPMTYGRISFAVIEDRKFKSGPEGKVNTWKGRPDHIKDKNFDTAKLDKPGLVMLGERQLKFLSDWATDWRGSDMKIVCSQTIFANVANYHGGNQMFLVADLDSNGWPQTGRNKALREMRRGFAFHLAGDQHLASVVQHGIDAWGDAGFSFCVPSIAAGYPRSWHPEREGKVGKNRKPGTPAYAGDFKDGLGNLISVYAVGNPDAKQRKDLLGRGHDKASGFGIVRLNKDTRKIDIECWRLLIDTANPKKGDQFPGFPMTIDMQDNYGRTAAAHLPTIEVTGMKDPVVQIIDQKTKQVVYTLRIKGTSFKAKVFDKDGVYTVKVGDPDSDKWQIKTDVKAGDGKIAVKF